MMIRQAALLLLAALLCGVGSCAGEQAGEQEGDAPRRKAESRQETEAVNSEGQRAPGASAQSDPLPLLPGGTHLGMVVTFEPLPKATRKKADVLWDRAVRAGMSTARVHLDWADLETGPGRYDRDTLKERLREYSREGLSSFVGIYAVDSGGLTLPRDLTDRRSPTGIAGGRSLNDPEILRRYARMLDWAVPLIVQEGGYVLTIANEPASYMEERRGEAESVIGFFRHAAEHVHRLNPRLAVTVTLTSTAAIEEKFYHDEVIEIVDAAAYNYYGLKLTDRFVLNTPFFETVPRDLATLINAAGGKPVLLQELGCPAGWSERPSVIGSTPSAQSDFFRVALREIRERPALRAAYVFQMVDWSGWLSETFVEGFLEEELPQPFIDSFREWLESSGFITYDQARVRPAWEVFLAACGN